MNLALRQPTFSKFTPHSANNDGVVQRLKQQNVMLTEVRHLPFHEFYFLKYLMVDHCKDYYYYFDNDYLLKFKPVPLIFYSSDNLDVYQGSPQ